jgi:glycosyltransferase AglE
MSTPPGVSVIVPAFNAAADLRLLLESLLRLDYPRDLLELIIVDNGSTDSTRDVAGEFPVTVLVETGRRGSYAARNRGILGARHGILAFTDADCVVTPGWIREGVRALASADLAAGKIEFTFRKGEGTAAEAYDALQHMQNDEYVRKYAGAATANLFVRAPLFASLGLFREEVRSGGDILWTGRATAAGHTLVFAPEAVVRHPARSLRELLIKGFRLGTGSRGLAVEHGHPLSRQIYEIVRSAFPTRMAPLRERVRQREAFHLEDRMLGLWWVHYLYRASRGLGLLYAVVTGAGARRTGGEPLT